MPSIITAPWAKLMMRSTPKIRERPLATSPYTPPSNRPLTTACRKSQVRRLALPLGDREHRLRLEEPGRPHHHRLAVLHLQQGGRRVHVLARLVEADRVLGQDVIGEVGLAEGVAHL